MNSTDHISSSLGVILWNLIKKYNLFVKKFHEIKHITTWKSNKQILTICMAWLYNILSAVMLADPTFVRSPVLFNCLHSASVKRNLEFKLATTKNINLVHIRERS